MASFQPYPAFAVDDTDGTPLAGGKLYTYASGTTTHKIAYVDTALTTPCTYISDGVGGLYILLDAAGQTDLVLASGAYTLKILRADGSLRDTLDGVTDARNAMTEDLAASSGAGLVEYCSSSVPVPASDHVFW